MLDRITSMQIFVSIIDQGSISAAARAHRISPTMASKHLSALEGQLGVQLVLRSTRRLTLTDHGVTYLEYCRRILVDIAESEAAILRNAVEPRGLLRVSVPVAFGQKYIVPKISQFLNTYPNLAVDLNLSDRFVNLGSGEFDLAVRITQMKDSDLKARKLCPVDIAVCASPAYLTKNGTPKNMREMSKHCVLGYPKTDEVARRIYRSNAGDALKQPSLPRFMCNNGDALVSAAVDGLGISIGPIYFTQDELDAGRLVRLEGITIPEMEGVSAHAVYAAHRRTPTNIRVMVDFFVELFKDGLPDNRNTSARV